MMVNGKMGNKSGEGRYTGKDLVEKRGLWV